jgi:hypothetical protein
MNDLDDAAPTLQPDRSDALDKNDAELKDGAAAPSVRTSFMSTNLDCCHISADDAPPAPPPPPPAGAETSANVTKVPSFQCNEDNIRNAVRDWCDLKTREACEARCGNISDWNTSKVTNCKKLFFDQKKFNDDISRWDTANVKRTDFMFESAESFNQPLAAWNLKNVETMERMFFKAKAFNQPLADWLGTDKPSAPWFKTGLND